MKGGDSCHVIINAPRLPRICQPGSQSPFPHMNLTQNEVAGCNMGFLSYSPTWMVECVPFQQLNEVQVYHTIDKERETQWQSQRSQLQQWEVIEVQLSIRSTGLCVSRLISCRIGHLCYFQHQHPADLFCWYMSLSLNEKQCTIYESLNTYTVFIIISAAYSEPQSSLFISICLIYIFHSLCLAWVFKRF